jgi:hypothetical protein
MTPDAAAEQIRQLAESVDDPSNWKATIPVEIFDDVKQILDTDSKQFGTEYNGVTICYKQGGEDVVKVKYRNTLEDHLEQTESGDSNE